MVISLYYKTMKRTGPLGYVLCFQTPKRYSLIEEQTLSLVLCLHEDILYKLII
jgi:hypothetical protein